MYIIVDEFGDIWTCNDDVEIGQWKEVSLGGYASIIDISDPLNPLDYQDGEWIEIENLKNGEQ